MMIVGPKVGQPPITSAFSHLPSSLPESVARPGRSRDREKFGKSAPGSGSLLRIF
jgi:hypothetical protein